jgi:hypothetical protein
LLEGREKETIPPQSHLGMRMFNLYTMHEIDRKA